MSKSENEKRRQSSVAVESKEPAGTVKSAARVLELLSFFAERRRSLTVTEIARALGYPQSSASALLTSLTKSGYLNYDRYNRQYTPTLRVALLGAWVHDQLFSPKSLSRLVDELHAASGRHVVLGLDAHGNGPIWSGGGSSTESIGGPRASRSDRHESDAAMRGGLPVDPRG